MLRCVPIVFTALCITAVSSCQQSQLTSEDIILTLDSLEHKLEWLDYRLAQEEWDLCTKGTADSLDYFFRLYSDVVSDNRSLDIIQRGKHLLNDEIDRRRRELVHSLLLLGHVEFKDDVSNLRNSLTTIDGSYQAEFEGEPRTAAFLYDIYQTEKNRVRREIAYRAWRAVGDELADGMERLIRLRNQRARRLGYNNFLAMSFARQNLDLQGYLMLLGRLETASDAPYREILGSAERRLGVNSLEIWDLAYAYSDIRREVDRYFPVDSQPQFIRRSLKEIGFNLDKLPIYFETDSLGNRRQPAQAFTVKSPHDVRVLVNLSDGFHSTRVLMREIGRALHSAYIDQEHALFVNTLEGVWSEGMATILEVFCDDPVWLETYAHLPRDLIARHLQAGRERDIIDLRLMLTRLMFEYEAYNNSNRDLNKLYWNLFERYMQLPRHDEIKPWAAELDYAIRPAYLQNYLFGDGVAAQTLSFLNRSYGSFVGDPNTQSFLVQNYLRFGSRYDWREMLTRGTGEKLKPDYLIERLGL